MALKIQREPFITTGIMSNSNGILISLNIQGICSRRFDSIALWAFCFLPERKREDLVLTDSGLIAYWIRFFHYFTSLQDVFRAGSIRLFLNPNPSCRWNLRLGAFNVLLRLFPQNSMRFAFAISRFQESRVSTPPGEPFRLFSRLALCLW